MHLTLRAGKPTAEGNPGRPANDQRDRGSLSNALDRNRPRIPHGVLVTRGQRRGGLPSPPLRLWQTQVAHQRQARAAPLPPRSIPHRDTRVAGTGTRSKAPHPEQLCGCQAMGPVRPTPSVACPTSPRQGALEVVSGNFPIGNVGVGHPRPGRVCRWRVSRCSSSPAGRPGRVRRVSSRWVRPPPRPLRASPRSRLQPPRPRSRAPG
jgi:hypothetical protein